MHFQWRQLCQNCCLPSEKGSTQVAFASFLTLAMLNKLRCHTHFYFPANQITWSGFLIEIHTFNETVQIQISWLLQKPTDLDLHCLQSQGMSCSAWEGLKWIYSIRNAFGPLRVHIRRSGLDGSVRYMSEALFLLGQATFFRGDLSLNIFLFSVFHWLKKGSCLFLAKECNG